MVTKALEASLIDPDGTVGEPTWQWQKADTFDATTWTDLSDATASSYTPTPGDTGKFLRALASYDDNQGTGKQASSTARNAVSRIDNQPPAFDEGETANREVSENAGLGTNVGAAVTATDPEGDTLTYSLSAVPIPISSRIDAGTGANNRADGAVLDYETTSSLVVTVNIADGKNPATVKTAVTTPYVNLNLENIDEPRRSLFPNNHAPVSEQIGPSLTPMAGETSLQRHGKSPVMVKRIGQNHGARRMPTLPPQMT